MKIKHITMAGSPSLSAEQGFTFDGEIESFEVNGEMAPVTWFRQTHADGSVTEVNGKYVERIDYFPTPITNEDNLK